jgi:hypothetical protein
MSTNIGSAGAALSEAPLSRVLGSVADGLIAAQSRLDARAAESATIFAETPAGTLAMPPLWYAFRDVRVELEMSASVAAMGKAQGVVSDPSSASDGSGELQCRLVNPASVSLFGYAASAGLRITMQLGVMGAQPIKADTENG